MVPARMGTFAWREPLHQRRRVSKLMAGIPALLAISAKLEILWRCPASQEPTTMLSSNLLALRVPLKLTAQTLQ